MNSHNKKYLTKKGTLKKQYKDPPRFPVLIELDDNMSREFRVHLKKLVIDITKTLKEIVK